ncbi:MAG TPA: ketoacyl-ACP synthase III [Planctomycetota bacterium]
MNRDRVACIRATAYSLPTNIESNELLVAELPGDWTAEKILAKTGIRSRHIAASGECASDLGAAAAEELFRTGACAPGDVDFLIVCTQSPDHVLPTTACLMQARLGLSRACGAVDVNQGCSGYVYGLALAKGLLETGAARNVLLITADTYSKYINKRDRSVRAIFGDGAAATLLSVVERGGEHIGPFVFGTDGRGAKHLIVPAGGCRVASTAAQAEEKEDASGNWRSDQDLFMNGPEVFSFTLRVVPPLFRELLEKAEMELSNVDRFIFHQANKFMLDHLRVKLGIPEEKFSVNLEDIGNTVSSTIPIALSRDRERGLVKPGDRVMLVGFGVGLSWAATMIRVQ